MIVKEKHRVYNTRCGRPYTTCSHSCKAPCHGDMPCPPYTELCEVSCNHSKCSKLCHEPCVPCAEDCSWTCPHRGRCSLPCTVPCDLLPCSERCVAYCQVCAHPTIKGMIDDFILSSTFEKVDLDENPCIIPPCGRIPTLESMDGHMSMSDFYTMNAEGSIVDLKNSAEPFSTSVMKSCLTF